MRTHCVMALLVGTALCGQSAAPGWLEFSIGAPEEGRAVFDGNGIRAQRVSLGTVIANAYNMPSADRVVGPEWLTSEYYSLTAVTARPQDFPPLLQRELKARFHLAAHRETRSMAVFVLRSPNGRLKLPSSGSGNTMGTNSDAGGIHKVEWQHARVRDFAAIMTRPCGRPVLDETGIVGYGDFTLKWTGSSVTALQAAVKDQLGLQLVEDHRPLDLLIVDRIEKLTFPQ